MQTKDKNAKVGDVISIPKLAGEYVVEEAEMTGGGTGHGPHDVYPDAWHVTARKLSEGGAYNPKGKTVTFTQNTNCYSTVIEGVQVLRRMQRTFVAG